LFSELHKSAKGPFGGFLLGDSFPLFLFFVIARPPFSCHCDCEPS